MKAWTKLLAVGYLAIAVAPAGVAQPSLNGCIPSGGQPRKCDVVQVPEPATLLLMAGGLLAIAIGRRPKK